MQVIGGVFILYLATSVFELQRSALAHDLNATNAEFWKREHKLSRHRRYLEFPEGSSFQFVYDVVVAVVDNVNYISVSITVALAWELPSEPPSEILEDLQDRVKEGTLGIARNDTVSQVAYTDVATSPNKYQSYRHRAPINDGIRENTHRHSWKRVEGNTLASLRSNPFLLQTQIGNQPKHTPMKRKYPWPLTENTHYMMAYHARRGDRRQQPFTNIQRQYTRMRLPQSVKQRPRDHYIFPILGKSTGLNAYETTHSRFRRSGITNDSPTKEERIHIRHQRKTRHELYRAIEKYLNRKSLKGHYCVLRALCETSQKAAEREPGSFVGELMRAIFTMPEPLADELHDNQQNYREQGYDAAQALKGDCSDQYHHCEHSLWSSSFVS